MWNAGQIHLKILLLTSTIASRTNTPSRVDRHPSEINSRISSAQTKSVSLDLALLVPGSTSAAAAAGANGNTAARASATAPVTIIGLAALTDVINAP